MWCMEGVAQAQQSQDTVVVTGTFEPAPLEEMDRTVHVFDLRKDGGLLFNSFADYLKLDSSVNLQERAADGVQADLSMRGGTFAQTLVLLNGMRLNSAQTAHSNMDIPVPMEAVTEMQVLRGSGSTQYGSDAVTGVVNLIVKPPETPEAMVRMAVGNFGRNEESGTVGGNWGPASEEIAFARDFSSGFEPDRDYRLLSLASISHLKTGLGATDLILSMSDRPFGADQFYGNFPSWERTKEWLAAARQELGSKTELDFSYRAANGSVRAVSRRSADFHESPYRGQFRRRCKKDGQFAAGCAGSLWCGDVFGCDRQQQPGAAFTAVRGGLCRLRHTGAEAFFPDGGAADGRVRGISDATEPDGERGVSGCRRNGS